MSFVRPILYRVIPDPQTTGKWAVDYPSHGQRVGGYASAKAATKAAKRQLKALRLAS